MKKSLYVILGLGVISLGITYFVQSYNPPACTYEYGVTGNSIKFEKACNEFKALRSQKSNELEKEIVQRKAIQKGLQEENNSIRQVQDKVAAEINAVRKQDEYAFRKAGK